MLIGSHNLLATPSRAELDNPTCDHCSTSSCTAPTALDADERAALFRLAWDFVGSSPGRAQRALRTLLPHLRQAQPHQPHLRHTDRTRADELVDGILHQA